MVNERSPYVGAVRAAAEAAGLDPLLVLAIIEGESAGRADAFRFERAYYARYIQRNGEWDEWEPRRVASSYGLMQVMYPTAVGVGYTGLPEGLFDIETNLKVGCAVLAGLMGRYKGDLVRALASYNGGHGAWSRPGPLSYAKARIASYAALGGNPEDPRYAGDLA